MEARILNITILMSLIIAIIIIYFFFSIIRYHRRYMRLQREKIFAEITIRENERKRIAGDLHDSLGPLLSAVKLNISSVDVESPDDRRVLDKTGDTSTRSSAACGGSPTICCPIPWKERGLWKRSGNSSTR
ncbi:histidine kinase [Puia sp. P3]|uniref:histidine kinase n=1 Tax=Puia sp. P3 TaxID=3423952 RepID=UPI003D66DE8C